MHNSIWILVLLLQLIEGSTKSDRQGRYGLMDIADDQDANENSRDGDIDTEPTAQLGDENMDQNENDKKGEGSLTKIEGDDVRLSVKGTGSNRKDTNEADQHIAANVKQKGNGGKYTGSLTKLDNKDAQFNVLGIDSNKKDTAFPINLDKDSKRLSEHSAWRNKKDENFPINLDNADAQFSVQGTYMKDEGFAVKLESAGVQFSEQKIESNKQHSGSHAKHDDAGIRFKSVQGARSM